MATCRRPSAALPCQRGDHRRRDRRARREGHQPLRAAAGCAVGGRRQQARLLRLRPALSRRLGPDRGAAGRSARSCWRNCWPAMSPAARPSSSAIMSRATARPLYERASETGARRHRLEARHGALPVRPLEDLDQDQGAAEPATSSLPATPRREAAEGLAALGAWPNGSTANCTIAARSAPASTRDTAQLLLERLEPLRRRDQARRRAEGDHLGAAGALRRASTTPTAPPTTACATPCSRGCARSNCRRRPQRRESG